MGRISAPWTLDGHQFTRSDGWYCGILLQHVQEKTIILFCGPPYTPPHCFRSITRVLVVHSRFAHWTNGIELLNQLLKIVRVQNDSFWQNEQKKEVGLIQQTSDMGGWSQQGWDGGLGPLCARSFDDSMTTRRVRPSVRPEFWRLDDDSAG